jgi:hypothetical protein
MAESGGADAFANAVVSTFGVIATPNQDQAAAERLGLRFRVYPCVVVRLSCRDCPPIGRYRLAVPADWLGAEALLVDFLEAISSTCRRNQGGTSGPSVSGTTNAYLLCLASASQTARGYRDNDD